MARLGVSRRGARPRRSGQLICEDSAADDRRRTYCSPAPGMRGDMVAAFQAALAREGAGGVVVAADVSRLAPTLYLADRSALVPRGRRPDYVESLLALCERHAIRAVLPLTDLDQSILTARRDDFARARRDRRRLGSRGLRPLASTSTPPTASSRSAASARRRPGCRASCRRRGPLPRARQGAARLRRTPHLPRATTPTSWRSSCATRPRSRWCRRSAAARSSRSTSSATSRAAASRPCRAR